MPFLSSGIYIRTSEMPYEAESSYYLKYQIKSALISIDKLMQDFDIAFDSKCQYCHYYTDHLLYSYGQISNRFVITPKDVGLTRERKEANRRNFEFTEVKYPILSDKCARNTIEHIDEHNQLVIEKCNGVGGFNLIDRETPEELTLVFRNERKSHPYTLDLVRGEIMIVRNGTSIDVNLASLKLELLALYDRVSSVYDTLQEMVRRQL
jgi:hypothetical protein